MCLHIDKMLPGREAGLRAAFVQNSIMMEGIAEHNGSGG